MNRMVDVYYLARKIWNVMNLKPCFFVVALLLLTIVPPAYAAFPITADTTTIEVAPPSHKHVTTSASTTFKKSSAPIRSDRKKYAYNGEPGFGIVALVCGLAGIILPIFGIPAIVFGLLGMERRLKGFAIAGLVLGILEVVFVLLAIVFAVAFAAGMLI